MTIPVDIVGGGGKVGITGGYVCWPQATSTCKMEDTSKFMTIYVVTKFYSYIANDNLMKLPII